MYRNSWIYWVFGLLFPVMVEVKYSYVFIELQNKVAMEKIAL